MCIFVHANSAAAVSIESIFATKRTICILCTSDVQLSREQNIIDFNKCCSCETTSDRADFFPCSVATLQKEGALKKSIMHVEPSQVPVTPPGADGGA